MLARWRPCWAQLACAFTQLAVLLLKTYVWPFGPVVVRADVTVVTSSALPPWPYSLTQPGPPNSSSTPSPPEASDITVLPRQETPRRIDLLGQCACPPLWRRTVFVLPLLVSDGRSPNWRAEIFRARLFLRRCQVCPSGDDCDGDDSSLVGRRYPSL